MNVSPSDCCELQALSRFLALDEAQLQTFFTAFEQRVRPKLTTDTLNWAQCLLRERSFKQRQNAEVDLNKCVEQMMGQNNFSCSSEDWQSQQ